MNGQHHTQELQHSTAGRRDCGDDLFREVNDRIVELGPPFGSDEQPLELICECDDSSCTHRVEISAVAFARLRVIEGLHLVALDHVHSGHVVGRSEGYLVVADD
jgi:hypothetical protein